MNYWQILGIEKTTGLAEIKRAYAARLKSTKPDDDPEGFKRLHAAYKKACQYARVSATGTTQADTPQLTELEQDTVHTATVSASPIVDTLQPVSEDVDNSFPADPTGQIATKNDDYQIELEQIATADIDEAFALLQAQWEELTRYIDEVTSSTDTINRLSSWDFLKDRDALLDLQFKSELSHYLFSKIGERLDEEDKKYLKREVFEFLDSLFLWSERRDLLEEDLGHQLVDAVMQAGSDVGEQGLIWRCPRFHKGEMIGAGYYARIAATVLDWLLLFFIAMLLAKLNFSFFSIAKDDHLLQGLAGVLLYGMLAPIMEATPMQGTPGKVLFGMKVVSNKGRRLNILHALLRSVMFSLSLAAIKITVWINFFLRDHRLLHDRFSISMVIKR